jgi:indole-3-glycerol phosphate synthase
MSGFRRVSQAISEGDGISLLVPVSEPAQAAGVEDEGADVIIAEGAAPGALREATSLPMLCRQGGFTPAAAVAGGADGYIISVSASGDEGRLRAVHLQAQGVGLEPVLAVADEDELEIALQNVDPEIFLLSARGIDPDEQLESVLDLLPDVPAGKLAIAEVPYAGQESVIALERAGVDGVIVSAADLPHLGGDEAPEV